MKEFNTVKTKTDFSRCFYSTPVGRQMRSEIPCCRQSNHSLPTAVYSNCKLVWFTHTLQNKWGGTI